MTLHTTGKMSFSQIRGEYGPSGSVSMSDYYDMGKNDGASVTFPSSGNALSVSAFYGAMYDAKVVYTTSNSSRTPRKSLARFIHIYVVGAGGSGGSCEIDTSGWVTGNGAASGGGAGGISYSKVGVSSFTGTFSTTIGAGGTGVSSGSESFIVGNAGTNTTLQGNGLTMVGGGGARGDADEQSTSGGDTSIAYSASGGTATGGGVANYTGGSSGTATVTGNEDTGATGGGGVNFVTSGSNDSANVGTDTASGGGLCSNDANPSILTTYLSARGQSIDFTDFDGTAGVRAHSGVSANSASAVFGGGSGGSSGRGSTRLSGDGGDGCVIFVYEV